ncbi:MAG: TIGR03668 family PPOX class F420-dependent oxidoreductase [Actinomycetota bacterium]|nr:TIGR03668 family PPOX class F420-dependent oxidoreductase [Actinomycetota bacterium]
MIAADVARLATRRPDGTIDLVPFVFAWMPGGEFGSLVSAVDHKPKRSTRLQRLANIAADPAVTVLIDWYTDDWAALWWVRMRGDATELAPGVESDEAVDALVAKYQQYRQRRPDGPVLRIDITQLVGWSANG